MLNKFKLLIFFIALSHDSISQVNSVLTSSGGTSTLNLSNKKYTVQYSVGQQGLIGFVKNNYSARQGFIQPPIFFKSINQNEKKISNEILKLNISLYPNPFVDLVNINLNEDIKDNLNVAIFDLSGRLVFEKVLPPIKRNVINLNKLKTSKYLIKVNTDNKIFNTIIIKAEK